MQLGGGDGSTQGRYPQHAAAGSDDALVAQGAYVIAYSTRVFAPFEPFAETGLIERMEAMRYRDADDPQKHLWILEPHGWAEFHGVSVPSPAAVTWADEGTPWLVLDLEEVVYNADVSDYIRAKGP